MQNLRKMWNNSKCTNIHIIRRPEVEEREKGAGRMFQEIMTENPKFEVIKYPKRFKQDKSKEIHQRPDTNSKKKRERELK